MPSRLVAGAAQPLERGDGVGDPAAERVDRVDEQQRVVGIHVGVGVERGLLAFAEGEEQLDHRVGVGACRRQPELVGDGGVRRRHGAADDRRPRTRRRRLAAAARRMPNSSTGRPRAASTTRAALVAISVAKLSWLSSGVSSSWAAASGPSTTVIGVFGCDDAALGHGVDAQSGEVERSRTSRRRRRRTGGRPPGSGGRAAPRRRPAWRASTSPSRRTARARRRRSTRPGARRSPGPSGRSARSGPAARAARSGQYSWAIVSW